MGVGFSTFLSTWTVRLPALLFGCTASLVVAGPLEIPTNARLLITGTNQASVMWVDNATGETGYEIQRRTGDSGSWGQVNLPAADATSWTDNAVPANSQVYYRVRTKNGAFTSVWSNVACLTNPGDSDADGIPDGVETAAGLDPSDWKDATADLDGDGVPNVWEYALSTDMTDDNSKPAPNITVDPSVVTETSSVKRTIHGAITALPSHSTNPPYSIVVVKPGVYEENISVASTQRVAILSDGSGSPPEIRGYSPHYNRIQVVEALGDMVIDGFRITRKAGDRGFGMTVFPNSSRRMVRVVNCLISEQQYPTGMGNGTGIEQKLGRLVVAHSVIYGNTRNGGQGAGLFSSTSSQESQAVSINSIYWNSPSGATSEVFHNGTATFVNCIIRNGSTWGGITSDPLLNPRGFLTSGSPAIGVGASGHGAPLDINIESRDASPDIGVDEFIDVDADGIPDRFETAGDLLPGGDDDGDGLGNLAEYATHGANPTIADSDGDGLNDGDEVTEGTRLAVSDSDDDGLPDGYEVLHGLNPLSIWDRLGDADGDRIPNFWEYKRGSSPSNAGSKPTTDWIVSPSQAGTGIYKATITQAVNAVTTAGAYAIIEVRPGTYFENVVTTSGRNILLLADQQMSPVEICAPDTTYAVRLNGEAVVDGFKLSRKPDAEEVTWPGIFVDADFKTIGLERVQTKVVNCFIHGHNRLDGGGIQLYTGRLMVSHCTITGNSASGNGNGISVGGNSLHLVNSIVWNPAGASASQVYKATAGEVVVANSVIYGGEHGALSSDPLLNPRGLLTKLSPAIGAGAAGYAGTDYQGEARTGAPDLGADEFVDSDSDGLPDTVEALGATDPGTDSDSDGLSNLAEYSTHGTHAHVADTDGDGLNDGGEVTAGTNAFNSDSDLDIMPDGFEVTYGLNPLNYRDALDDEDGDRIPNVYEWANSTDPTNSSSVPVAHYTVDPAATPSATVKNTISAAVTAANGTTPEYKIIFVKAGTYEEPMHVTTRALLILGEPGLQLPVISPDSASFFVVLNKHHAMVDGFEIRADDGVIGSNGVFAGSGKYRRLVNCRIHGHRGANGPAIYLQAGELSVVNCTIFGNAHPMTGPVSTRSSGIYLFNAHLHMVNSILWNTEQAGLIPHIVKGAGTIEVNNSIILGGEFGASGLDPLLDPVFGILRSGSPAINAGSASILGVTHGDFQGESRVGSPDIGADEYVDADSDGLPDVWEQHFYSNLAYSSTDDTDWDGVNNSQELANGTDPNVQDGEGPPDPLRAPMAPWQPSDSYVIGAPTTTGSISGASTGPWTVQTNATGFSSTNESAFWLPTGVKNGAVLEWTPVPTSLQGVGDLAGIMFRLSEDDETGKPFVFLGLRKTASSPSVQYQVEVAWRSSESQVQHRRIPNFTLPGGAFATGMRFRLELISGRVVLSFGRPKSGGAGFEPWEQRMAIELGGEDLWTGAEAPLVFGGMAFSSGTGGTSSFSIASDELQIGPGGSGTRWWRVAEPHDLNTESVDPLRLGMQNLLTEFSNADVDVDLINPGSVPTSSEIWNADYWQGSVTGASPVLKSLNLSGIVHPTPREYVDVYMRVCGMDSDGVGTDTARPALSVESNGNAVNLASAPAVGGGSAENDTWVYVGRLGAESTTYTDLTREIDCILTWNLAGLGSAGSLSKFTFDGLLFVGGSTQADANEDQIPDDRDPAGLYTRGGDWDGDGWEDAEEFMLGSNGSAADSPLPLPTITALPGPDPLYIARGHWSPTPVSVKVTYDSAGTKPVKGYGVELVFEDRLGDVGFATTRLAQPQFSNFRGTTDENGVFTSEVWASSRSAIPSSGQSYHVRAESPGASGPTPVQFALRTYDNHAPHSINADGVTRGLGFTVPFVHSVAGKIAATGNWLATGDPLGHTTMDLGGVTAFLPSFSNINLPDMGQAVILWRWNPYDGGFWQPTQFLVPDSTADTGFGSSIVINEHPDPAMGASALMAVAVGGTISKLYVYALSEDGTIWRRWPRDNFVMSIPAGSSPAAFHGRWLALSNPNSSRGKVDLYRFVPQGVPGNYSWFFPTSVAQTLTPTVTGNSDLFGTSVSFSENGQRLVVGAPTNRSPAFPNQTGVAEPSVYVYEPATSGTSWNLVSPVLQNTVSTPAGGTWSDWTNFGQSVLAAGDQVVVGAPIMGGGADTSLYATLGQPGGAIASYRLQSGAWVQTGLYNGPYYTFGHELAGGSPWVYATAATLDTYLLNGNVVTASSDPEDNIWPLPAFVRSYRFDSGGLLVEESGGELTMGHTTAAKPIAASGASLFAMRTENEGHLHTYGEFRWMPSVNRSLAENSVVATLDVEDLQWNNPTLFPFETMALTLTEPVTLWSVTAANGLWDLKMIDEDLLQASQSDVFWLGLQAADLAGDTHVEFLGIKLNRLLEAPEITSGRWINANAVEIGWDYEAVNPDNYLAEYASLNGSPGPAYSITGVVTGNERKAQLEVTPGSAGVATRLKSRIGNDSSSYSNEYTIPYDSDADGLPDWWEALLGGSANPSADPDGDNLTNLQEFNGGTNPYAADTDGDGINDDVDSSSLNRNSNATGVVVHTVLQP